ncbi:MAG: YiiX/YebB-like N1pC/P60 family cysteine hydrolase [Flavobacteriales bacterium]
MNWKRWLSIALAVLALLLCAFLWIYDEDTAGLRLDRRRQLWRAARPDITALRSGDLIFRHGRGVISNTLLKMSQREAKYSHAGVLIIEDGKAYVYHCIGGEDNPNSKMRRDHVSQFCDPEIAHAFGIYRLPLNENVNQRFLDEVKRKHEDGMLFDTSFDLTTDDEQYCTEFIFKILRSLEGMDLPLSSSTFSGKEYVTCDNLYLIPNTQLIHQHNY